MIVRVEREGCDILVGHSATGGVSTSKDLGMSWKKIDDPLALALSGEVDILEAYQTICDNPLESELVGYQVQKTIPETPNHWDKVMGNGWLRNM